MRHRGSTHLRDATAILLLLALSAQAGTAFAESHPSKTPLATAQELHVKRTYLEELQHDLEASCVDKDGKLKSEQRVTPELSCLDAAVDYNNKVVAFKAEIRELEEKAAARTDEHANSCAGKESAANLAALSGMIEGLKENVETGCKNERTFSICAKDFACNLAGSMAMPFQGYGKAAGALADTFEVRAKSRIMDMTFGKIRQTWAKFDGVCPKQDSQCFEQIMHGVVKALWSDITALGSLAEWSKNAPGAAWSGMKNVYQDVKAGSLGGWIYDKLHQSDSKVALTQHIAGQLSDAELKAAAESNRGKITAFFSKIFKSLSDSVRENYACEKFKPAPNQFQCEVPLQSWECASCNSVINSVCGVVGVLGAEFVTSVVIGGVTGVASAAVEAGAAFGGTARKAVILQSANSSLLQKAIEAKSSVAKAFSKPVGSVKEVGLFQSVSTSVKNVLQRSTLIKDLVSLEGMKAKFPYIARRTKDGVIYVARKMQNVAGLKGAGAALESKLIKSEATQVVSKASGEGLLSKAYVYSGAKLAVSAVSATGKGVVDGAAWYLDKLDQGFRLGYSIPRAPFHRSISGVVRATGSAKQSQLIDSTELGNARIEEIVGAADGPIGAEQMKEIEAIQARQLEEAKKILDAHNVRYSIDGGAIKIHEFDGNFGRMIQSRLAEQAVEVKPQLARDLKAAVETTGDSAHLDHLIDRAVDSFLTKHTTFHPSNGVFYRLYGNGTITRKQFASLVKGADSQSLTEELKGELRAQLYGEGALMGSVKLKSTFAVKPDYLLSREVLAPSDLGSIYEVGDNALVQIARRHSQHAGGNSGLEGVIRAMPNDAGQANIAMSQYRRYTIDKTLHTKARLRNYSAREVTNIANEAAERAEAALQANGILYSVREVEGVRYFEIQPVSTGNDLTLELSQRAQQALKKGYTARGTIYIPGDSVLKDSETWQAVRESMQKKFSDRDYHFLTMKDLTSIRHAQNHFAPVKVELVQELLSLSEENRFVAKDFAKALARKPSMTEDSLFDANAIKARNAAMNEYQDSLLRSIDTVKANQLVERTEQILKKSFVSYKKVNGADGRVFLQIEKNYDSPLNVYASFHARDVLFYPGMKEITATARSSSLPRLSNELGYDHRFQTFISLDELQDAVLVNPELIERFRKVTTAARPEAYSELMETVRKAARQTTNVAGQASGEHGGTSSAQKQVSSHP